jgi:hypothetical protein
MPLVSFDYAIKYLLKDKCDYAIVEGFISAIHKACFNTLRLIVLIILHKGKTAPK